MMMLDIGLEISADELVTGRTCIIAQTGAGKSYAIAVILEELLDKEVPFCIIDTEGEYKSLKEKFSALWVGGEDAEMSFEGVNLEELGKQCLENNVPLIFDTSELLDENVKVEGILSSLYSAASELKKPYLVVVEEVDKFAPQASRKVMPKLLEIAKRGRKRGLGLLIASQRPAFVNKDLLSQCGSQMIGKLTIKNDLDAVRLFFDDRNQLLELPDLDTGEFFVMGNVVDNEMKKVKVKERMTRHVAFTPKIKKTSPPKIEKIKKLLERKPEVLSEAGALKLRMTEQEAIKEFNKRRKKKYCFFGKPVEEVGPVELVYRPFIKVVARVVGRNFLGKVGFKDLSLVLNGVNACFVKRGEEYCGAKKLLGLSPVSVRIMVELMDSKEDLSVSDIVENTMVSESKVRKELRELQKNKLVTVTSKKRRENYYSPLIKFKTPDLFELHSELGSETDLVKGEKVEPEVKEEEVKQLIKGLVPGAEILVYETIFKPYYKAVLQGEEKRVEWVDASQS